MTLALTGCGKIDMAVELNSDDTYDATVTFAVSNEFAELAGMDVQELADEAASGVLEDAPASTKVTPYDDGTFVGSTLTFDGAPISVLDGADDALKVVRDGDEFIVTGKLDLAEGAEELESMPGIPQPDVTIAVTFPGEVVEHSGTLEGSTVTWNGEIGEVLEISARGGAVESSTNIAAVAGSIVAILLAAGAAIFWFVRKGTSSTGRGDVGGGQYGQPYAPPQAFPTAPVGEQTYAPPATQAGFGQPGFSAPPPQPGFGTPPSAGFPTAGPTPWNS